MKVLFVDDEESVLHGLERLLSMLDTDWECEFANGGAAGLTVLGQNSFDVVISDLRMPQMDGAALLKTVQIRYPETVRIVLSGQADKETSLKAVASAHQFLAKPCAPDTLMGALERAQLLRRLIGDHALRGLVSKLPNLPSVPAAYEALVKELDMPDVAMDRVCNIIASEVAMSAKVLQLVNSAFFGLPRQISDVRQAVSLLGLDLLGSLVLSAQAFSTFPISGPAASRAQAIQTHSLSVSVIARKVATNFGCSRSDADAAAVAGMLSGIGELVISAEAPFAARQIADAISKGKSAWSSERGILGTTHAEVGAYLLGIWGLPIAVVQSVADQAAPTVETGGSPTMSLVVHLADAYVSEMNNANPQQENYLSGLSPTILESETGVQLAKSAWEHMEQCQCAA